MKQRLMGQAKRNQQRSLVTPDGRRRTYVVHIPPSYDPTRATPVVLVLHGGGGDAQGTEKLTLMNVASDKYGFLAVYPEGTGPKIGGKVVGSWNAGRCCPQAMKQNIDDVGFISGLIDKLQKDLNVDPKRIYATGISNGAMMSYRLACELSDRIAAIAPVIAQGTFDQCAPERPVPLIHFHGTADPCAPYQGGTGGGCLQDFINEIFGTKAPPYTWAADSVPDYIAKWVRRNGLTGSPEVMYKNGKATCEAWGRDQAGEVVLCTVEGMGHNWPGGTFGPICEKPQSKLCKRYQEKVGPLSSDISANDAMWEFFKKHPMP
jgi:polyhydroxybutyrate depolymerase